MLSFSSTSRWARARDRGAGPRTTLPWKLYCEPWHGHMNLFSAAFHGTTHPRCVHTAFSPYFSIVLSSLTIKYVASPLRPCTSSRDGAAWVESHFFVVTSSPSASL